jgi:hypothetical protein
VQIISNSDMRYEMQLGQVFLPRERIKLTICSKYHHVFISKDMTAIMSLHPAQHSFSTGQSWGALRKAWKGYRIAKVQGDNGKMTEYATKIRKIQGELGISLASFPNLGLS